VRLSAFLTGLSAPGDAFNLVPAEEAGHAQDAKFPLVGEQLIFFIVGIAFDNESANGQFVVLKT
jgi:hypothetical protein